MADSSMELTQHNKRMDALVSRILELCEKEDATLFEMQMLSPRLEREIVDAIAKQEKETHFNSEHGKGT